MFPVVPGNFFLSTKAHARASRCRNLITLYYPQSGAVLLLTDGNAPRKMSSVYESSSIGHGGLWS